MNSDQIREAARRLRAGENPAEVAADLERRAARGPGHPPDPAWERARRTLRRATVADGIYGGTFPVGLVPVGVRMPDSKPTRYGSQRYVQNAKGSRERADKATAALLNTSVRRVQAARTWMGRLREGGLLQIRETATGFQLESNREGKWVVSDQDWEEFAALALLHARHQSPK